MIAKFKSWTRKNMIVTTTQAQELKNNSKLPLNYFIAKVYNEEQGIDCSEYLTLADWNVKGFKVLRGEKGFSFWGKPLFNNDGSVYFPIEKRFNILQVARW